MQEAARTVGQQIDPLYASTDTELEVVFAALMKNPMRGLLVTADPFFDTRQDYIFAAVARSRLPAIYHSRAYALAGGLMSYGISYIDIYRQAGVYAGRILQGANPAELPVMQPTKFELVINLKAANALGVTMSPLLLAQADEVIE